MKVRYQNPYSMGIEWKHLLGWERGRGFIHLTQTQCDRCRINHVRKSIWHWSWSSAISRRPLVWTERAAIIILFSPSLSLKFVRPPHGFSFLAPLKLYSLSSLYLTVHIAMNYKWRTSRERDEEKQDPLVFLFRFSMKMKGSWKWVASNIDKVQKHV